MNVSDLQVRVARKATEAMDISTFELVNVDDRPLPAFSAGSHIDVHLPNGLTRQYSLCNDPSEGHRYLIGVLRDVASRGGSQAMHEQVKEGDVLHVSAPKNHFPLAHEATHSVLMAGGIGVTPILCMAERLAVTGASFEMHYCTRSPERTAFRERIAASTFSSRVHFHFDDGPESQKLQLNRLLTPMRPGVHLYVCGPKGFMDALKIFYLGDLSAPNELDADDLCTWAELVSGRRVQEGGGVTNLTGEEWLQRWRDFRRRHPAYPRLHLTNAAGHGLAATANETAGP